MRISFPIGLTSSARALSARITRSSSSLCAISLSFTDSMRKTVFSSQLEAAFKNQMAGLKTTVNHRSGWLMNSAMGSGRRMARILGTCSPSVMCRQVMPAKPSTTQIVWMAVALTIPIL